MKTGTVLTAAPQPEAWKTECHSLFGACWNGDNADIGAAWYRAYLHMRNWAPAEDPDRRRKIVYCFCKSILGKRPEISRTSMVTPDGRIVETTEVRRG